MEANKLKYHILFYVGWVSLGQEALNREGFLKGERAPLDISVADGGSDDGGRLGSFSAPTPLSSIIFLLLTDGALVEEVAGFPDGGFSNKFLSPVCQLMGRSSSSASSNVQRRGFFSGRTESLVL